MREHLAQLLIIAIGTVFVTPSFAAPANAVDSKSSEMAEEEGGPEEAASEDVEATAAVTEEEARPFGGTVTFSNSVGFGTFIPGEFTDRPAYDITFVVAPYYKIDDHQRISSSISVTQNVITNADSVVTRSNQALLSDLLLSYSYS